MFLELPKVSRIYWRSRSIAINCPVAVTTILAESNNKRRWVALHNPVAYGQTVIIVPTNEVPIVTASGWIWLDPGGWVIFSMTGDMPWQGAIYGIGQSGTAAIFGIEVSDFP